MDEVAVVGGGIGGLTAALALVHHSVACAVYERAPELNEIGAGLGVWPAPLRVYDRLGIGSAVRALSAPYEEAGIRRSDGRYVVRYGPADLTRRLGEPTIGVHRGELQALLLAALPAGIVHTGHECVGVAEEADRVRLRFTDGAEVTAPAVVAADGRRSVIRRCLFTDRELHDSRSAGWRGTAPAPEGSDWHTFSGETWGAGGRFGLVPIGGGRVTWYAAVRRFESGGDLDEVRRRFGSWHHPIPAVIEATPPDQLWADRLDDLWPRRRWVRERVALLGDAAHPMTADLGQGACQAILDAWVLAEELAGTADVAAAFRSYERRRRLRAAMVTLVARAATSGGRQDSARAIALRSAVACRIPTGLLLRALAFIVRE